MPPASPDDLSVSNTSDIENDLKIALTILVALLRDTPADPITAAPVATARTCLNSLISPLCRPQKSMIPNLWAIGRQ